MTYFAAIDVSSEWSSLCVLDDGGGLVREAIDEGPSCRQAATRFGVSASSAIRRQAIRRSGGDIWPKPQGGDRLSRRTEAHAELIHAALAEVPDITLPELKDIRRGAGAGRGSRACRADTALERRQAKGRITRLKRSMYGRAGFDLLRRRLRLAA